MAARGAPKGRRPAGWSKALALELAAGAGSLEAELRRIGAVVGCKVVTLKAEMLRWSKSDPEFRREYLELMAGKHRGRGGRPVVFTDEKKAEFLAAYGTERRILPACTKAGVAYRTLWAAISPSNASYDKPFHEAFENLRRELVAAYEDVVSEIVLDPAIEPRVRLHGALRALESLDKANWSRTNQVTLQGKVEHEHKVILDPEKIRATIAKEFQHFLPAPAPSTTAEEPIEGEVVDATH